MSGPYRPSPEQLHLFGELAFEIRERGPEYLSAASWFGRDFSIKAIDARKSADLTPEDEWFREAREREGFVIHQRRDPSGYMERLLRATENLIEIDDSALPKPARLEHYRRVILVGTLLTDPDFDEELPDLAKALEMDRSHWSTPESLTVGGDREIELDRTWARVQVFDPDFPSYVPFQPLAERALAAVAAVRPRDVKPSSAPAGKRASIAPDHPTPPLDITESKILDALRKPTVQGKGLTLRTLMSIVDVSAQSTISRAIERLRRLGHPIKNRGGARGYWLDGHNVMPPEQRKKPRTKRARSTRKRR